jgi:hypothetical protein
MHCCALCITWCWNSSFELCHALQRIPSTVPPEDDSDSEGCVPLHSDFADEAADDGMRQAAAEHVTLQGAPAAEFTPLAEEHAAQREAEFLARAEAVCSNQQPLHVSLHLQFCSHNSRHSRQATFHTH